MRRAALLLLVAALGACSKAAQPIVLQPPTGPPPDVDTRYRGTARLVRAANQFCPRSGPRVYEVQNGAIALSYQAAGRRRVPISAPVQADGTFEATDGEGRLQGQLVNGLLEITISSEFCEHRWTLRPVS